ncbi:MAG: hypothetical protein KAR57_08740 [Bacteroidales bacterium]|nr:hypothetical protein [Bacteroidales bacterium]
MDLRIRSQISSLDALFLTAERIEEEELQAHFSKYLCVKTSGLFENYIKSQVGDFVQSSSAKPTSNFVKSKIKRFTNIDYKKITEFLTAFSQNWTEQFNDKLSDDLKSSLNAIISNRNNIAHGHNDSITMRNMREHYENMKRIISILDGIIKK